MCGTINPTNAIGPHAAVAAPVSTVIAAMPITRVVTTLVPSERATSSPRLSRFRAGVEASATSNPTTMNGSTCQKTSMPRPATEPTTQKR